MTRLSNRLAKLAERRTILNSQIYVLEHKRDYNSGYLSPFSDEEETCLYYLHEELSDLELTIARLSKKS